MTKILKKKIIYTSPCYGISIEECLTKREGRNGEGSALYSFGIGLANKKKIFKITIEELSGLNLLQRNGG